MSYIHRLGLAGVLVTASGFAQLNTLVQTSLSAAITADATVLTVASATGIVVPNVTNGTIGGSVGSILYIVDPGSRGEAVRVRAVNGTSVTVTRGVMGTQAIPHINTAMVLVGLPHWFYSYDPQGACTAANTFVTPWVNVTTGAEWLCSTVSGSWVPGWNNDFTSPSLTAAVASAAFITPTGPLFHVTGTTAITGFSTPVGFPNFGSFCVIPDAIFTTTTAINIALASTAVVNKVLCWTFDYANAKFVPSY